nr:hypothetical protein [Tanacetum cinerariifolium]
LRDSGLCWGRWESDCRSSGSGGEGSKKWGEVVAEEVLELYMCFFSHGPCAYNIEMMVEKPLVVAV